MLRLEGSQKIVLQNIIVSPRGEDQLVAKALHAQIAYLVAMASFMDEEFFSRMMANMWRWPGSGSTVVYLGDS